MATIKKEDIKREMVIDSRRSKSLMKQHIPNFVTGLRIALTPLIAFVLWQPQEKWLTALGLVLFIIASASDWLDGYLARQMNIVSPIGRMLDPIADKLLVAACLLSLIHI